MNVEKLKITALKHEKREDWRKAIDVYLKVIEAFESGAAISHDLSVYNRVGDLYMKVKQTPSAVQSYERAVDLYADQGMINQAIALCGKVLRVNPGRVQTYLKLARLHAEKNVVVDARKNLLEYLERMNALGNRDDALEEVKAFADRFGRNEDIRVMLGALLRALSRDPEMQEQLEELADQLESRGDAEGARGSREHADDPSQGPEGPGGGLIFLDTGTGLRAPAPIEKTPVGTSSSAMEPPAVEDAPSVDLEVDRGRYEEDTEELEIESVGDLENTSLEVDEAGGVPALDGLLVDSASELSAESAGSVDELDVTIEHTLGDEDALSLEVELDEDADTEPEEEAEVDLPAEPAMDQAEVEVAEVEVEEAEVEVEEAEVEVEEAEVEVEEAEVEEAEVEEAEAEVEGVEGVEEVEEEEFEEAEVEEAEVEEAEVEKTPLTASDIPPGPLGFLRTEEPVGPTVEELEDRILDDPDDPA
ncbi:MAG: tetratricopeptide repeat protein, partial [Acidimicrobiia bacterium]